MVTTVVARTPSLLPLEGSDVAFSGGLRVWATFGGLTVTVTLGLGVHGCRGEGLDEINLDPW